jgi:hypothetical protein
MSILKSKLFALAVTALVALFVHTIDARADDCAQCVERKKGMCAQECRLVPAEKSLICQSDCVQQYCLHRCPTLNPAIGEMPQSCDECRDQQFTLCEANCPLGTDRVRSMCKLGCAKQRCEALCSTAEIS